MAPLHDRRGGAPLHVKEAGPAGLLAPDTLGEQCAEQPTDR